MLPWSKNDLLSKALSLYAGDQVLKYVLSGGKAALGPNARSIELTLLYLDVTGLDAQTEGFNSVELCHFMMNYYESITKSISCFGGIFDTFVGYSASAWWGVNGESDHALSACKCAKDLLTTANLLNGKSTAIGHHEIRFKIGIHTGIVALGNFGSYDRLRFTVMGDAVNLASSLRGCANSEYAFPILLSNDTNKRLGGKLQTELVDTVRVRGKDDPMEIYGLAF